MQLKKKYFLSVIGWTHRWEIHGYGRTFVSQHISLPFKKFYLFIIYLFICVCEEVRGSRSGQFSSSLCGFNLEYQGIAEDDFELLMIMPPLSDS